MKIFEDMKEMGRTINDVIQKMINDVFNEELDDDQVKEIVSKLSLSDILSLDNAYTAGDNEAIQDILGPLPTMEYSMGGNHPTASAASSRPTVQPAGGAAANKKPGAQNTTQTNRSYSGGVQNGVITKNIDNEDDPEQVDPEEPIEESDDGDTTWEVTMPIDTPVQTGEKIYNALNKRGIDYDDLGWSYEKNDSIVTVLCNDHSSARKVSGILRRFIHPAKNQLPKIKEIRNDNMPVEEAGPPDYNPDSRGHDDYNLEQLAAEYHATMAGMGHRDEQDIIDDMYAIADPDAVDDILNGINEAGAPDYNPARGGYNNAECEFCGTTNDLHQCRTCDTDFCPSCAGPDSECPHCGDPDNAMLNMSEEQVDESIPSAFHIGDEVIDDQGRTGVISGKPYMDHIHVNFYNYGEKAVKMSNLQLNDYAGSDEEDNDQLDIYSQAEYDRIHSGDEFEESIEESAGVVDMVKWLKRRAGLD